MKRSRTGMLIFALIMALCAPVDAGYSSGKSSVSRSSSHRSSASRSHSSSSSASRSHSSSYSSGKGSSYSSRSGSSSFGSSAAAAKRREESRSSVTSSASPGSYGPPIASPAPRPAAPSASEQRRRQMTYLRSHVSAESFSTRLQRNESLFGSYMQRSYSGFSYRDNYSPWFWMWLLDRPANQQADWAYHHRYAMDQARYQQLVAQNAALQQRVTELENQNLTRDPAYVPEGLPEEQADLMYVDSTVAAATRPVVAPSTLSAPSAPIQVEREDVSTAISPVPAPQQMPMAMPMTHLSISHGSSGGGLFAGLFFVAVIGAVLASIIQLMRRAFTSATGPVDFSPAASGLPIRTRTAPLQSQPTAQAQDEPVARENPLQLAVSERVTLDLADYAGAMFSVEQIQHYATRADGESFHYTAYDAVSSDGQRVQLRVERLPSGELAVLALHLHDEMDYSREFYDIVETDRTGLFQITDDDTGEVQAEYRRPEGVLSAFSATVATETGQATSMTTRKIQYWDYSRTIEAPEGTTSEFLIVELEPTGRFRIFVGPQVSPSACRKA